MPTSAIFRPAAPASPSRNFLKTALQCVVIWTVTLVVLPAAVLLVERTFGIPGFVVAGQRVLGALLFVAFSALNVRTGGVLAALGRGTPLPLDCPRELVMTGPYAYVRNPMAIAGLGQGLAVALWLGSWGVLAYVVLGISIWQWGARPAEERDLEARFGAEYRAYRAAVACWVPRRRPYVAPSRDAE